MLNDSVGTTEVYEVVPSGGEIVADVVTSAVAPGTAQAPALPERAEDYPPLTAQQDMFCLAVIEYGGNIRKAYEEAFGVGASTPLARGRALLALPQVALRIRELTESVKEAALVSLGSHLTELADIRDLAKETGQLKTALDAETARGKVAGFYIGKEGTPAKGGTGAGVNNPMVLISISTRHDQNI